MLTNKFTIKEIILALVESVIVFYPEYFKPYILSDFVQCDAEKKPFYKLFKMMVCSAKASSEGPLKLKIEHRDDEHPEKQYYCFYDARHVHPRLTIIVVENEDSIWIEVAPF